METDSQLDIYSALKDNHNKVLRSTGALAASYAAAAADSSAGIFKESTGARNRVGIGLAYRLVGYTAWRNWFSGIDSWLLKSLKILAPIFSLARAEFVYMWKGSQQKPLAAPSAGPYMMQARGAKAFIIQVGQNQELISISVDRMKAHTGSGPVSLAEPPHPRPSLQIHEEDAVWEVVAAADVIEIAMPRWIN
jgi:hypothetical protein